jgi:hypothetical protein
MTKEAQEVARMARDAYRDTLADIATAMKLEEEKARRLHGREKQENAA